MNPPNLKTAQGRARYRLMELDTQVYTDPTDTYTVVVVTGERYTGVGVAKRAAFDPVDPQIGYDLASARALRELAAMAEEGAHAASDPPDVAAGEGVWSQSRDTFSAYLETRDDHQ